MPSRPSCRQTLRAPLTRTLTFQTRWISILSCSSCLTRAERLSGSLSQASWWWYVDGAIGSKAQIALDPAGRTVVINEGHYHFGLRSNSARAKTAVALRKISLARLSSRFTRSSCLYSRSDGTPVGRCCASSACWHQRLQVSDVQPIPGNRVEGGPAGWVVFFLLKNQSDSRLSDFGGMTSGCIHDSTLSKPGVSGEAGAVHFDQARKESMPESLGRCLTVYRPVCLAESAKMVDATCHGDFGYSQAFLSGLH